MEVLQTMVLPNLEVQAPEAMYVRLEPRVYAELESASLRFAEGGIATLDTFYGGLSARPWKQHTAVERLRVRVEGSGEFLLAIGWHRLGRAPVWLAEKRVVMKAGTALDVPVEQWADVDDGILFVRLRALGPGTITSLRWTTPDAAAQEVRLGAVITHFNRQKQVLPAIGRLRRFLRERRDIGDRITLTVVDNSRNLPVPVADNIKRLPNRNLGGTGGFVRGLLDLIDGGAHTHALFMDDDASCEPESLARTLALLAHASTPRLAVAGALLDELSPWRLMEKGACFDGMCRALHAGRDVQFVDELLRAEAGEPPDYGGWWFFAFPLDGIRRFPFPFFVRGDDVFFSLTNRFEIVTMNGIACFGDDFAFKHGPMTNYLDSRYHLLHALLHEERGARAVWRLARTLFVKPLAAYHYATARGFVLAMRHLAQGPRFFRENLDTAAIRAEIAAWSPAEKLQPLAALPAVLDGRGLREARREPGWRRALRSLTLHGLLLPRALLKNRTLIHPKSFHGDGASVFRYRRVLYRHEASGTGYLAEHDKRQWMAEWRGFFSAARTLLRQWPQLRALHREGFDAMASEAFWREVYAEETRAMPRDDEALAATRAVATRASGARPAAAATGSSAAGSSAGAAAGGALSAAAGGAGARSTAAATTATSARSAAGAKGSSV